MLLGGTVRPTPLHQATGRSVLDLPLDGRGSILDGWLREARRLAGANPDECRRQLEYLPHVKFGEGGFRGGSGKYLRLAIENGLWGADRVILYVDARNTAAVRLYERGGFTLDHADTLYGSTR